MPGCMLHLAWQTKDAEGALHGMPSPVDGDPSTPWPPDFWLPYSARFMRAGGTVNVLPPLTKGATLGIGYDPNNHYDLGSNPHGPAGRRETRYGSVEQIMAFIARTRAMGMENYVNVVHHHVDGDKGDYRYDYIAGDGKTPGRFPKDENCFWVYDAKTAPVNPDGVFDNNWDLQDGREFRWESGTYGDGQGKNGPGYVRHGLAGALDWQTRRLAVDGYFWDDGKGQPTDYVEWALNQMSMSGKFCFAEVSDGATWQQIEWMRQVNQRSGVLDFPLRYKIRDVCNSSADMRTILSEGVCWTNPLQACTFTSNIDLDISDPIISRALLGNSMILGFPGYPMLFGKDLYAKPFGYGLETPVLNLLWCYSTFGKGDHQWRAAEPDHLIWERMGDSTSSGMLCCASIRGDWTKVTVPTKWKGTWLHDYTGQAEDQKTDAQGNLTFWMPPDGVGMAGRGYVRYAVQDVDNPIKLKPRATAHELIFAGDLDIPALVNGQAIVSQIECADGTPISLSLKLGAELPAGASIVMQVRQPGGLAQLGASRPNATTLDLTAWADGAHPLVLSTAGLPPDVGVSGSLFATYTADTGST